MAIDFPASPVAGSTYTYQGVTYTWIDTSGMGGADGYWKVNQPGQTGPATGAEVDTGTDNAKYVTPLAMEDSSYIKTADVQALLPDVSITDTSGAGYTAHWTVIKYPNGVMEVKALITGGGTTSNVGNWSVDFPTSFTAPDADTKWYPSMTITSQNLFGSHNVEECYVTNGGIDSSKVTATFRMIRSSAGTSATQYFGLTATGLWKTFEP